MFPKSSELASRLHEQPSRKSHRLDTSGTAVFTISATTASVRSMSSERLVGAAFETVPAGGKRTGLVVQQDDGGLPVVEQRAV